MAFDPKKFKVSAPVMRSLPVVLLLDVSGSMNGMCSDGKRKIDSLHEATVQMIDSFIDQELKETVIDVSIITFGASLDLHTPYTPVSSLKSNSIQEFKASGGTPLGHVLAMAKEMIEDSETTSKKSYRHVVVLVSDGQPTDEWRQSMNEFLTTGRTQKCQRYSVAIGDEASTTEALRNFAQDSESLFIASDAADLADTFKKVSTSAVENERKSRVIPVQSENPKTESTHSSGTPVANEGASRPGIWGNNRKF